MSHGPTSAAGTDPTTSQKARGRFGEPCRAWVAAPAARDTAAAVRSAVTTAEAFPTPRKISAGVISAPPPIPVRPTTMPTKKPAATMEKKSAVSQPATRPSSRRTGPVAAAR